MPDEIVEMLGKRGWNLYECLGGESIKDFSKRGPSESLENGSMYVVFPKVEDPKNFDMLKEAAGKISNSRDGEGPRIIYNGKAIPVCLIRMRKNYVVVRHAIEDCIPYKDFIGSLDSLNFWDEDKNVK